jgi:5,10-methylenetetrahydrofolate reductase
MSKLEDKIRSRQFVVTSELTPPKGTDLSDLFAKANLLKSHVDAFNLTESPRARMAIEPTAAAHHLLNRGMEPIVQITARDRNRIAIQADLLGASSLGIENFVFMNGDMPQGGDHPDAKPVFDLSTPEMIGAARMLSQGRDLAGNALKGSPHVFIGAVTNPGAGNLTAEVASARRKIDEGAQFMQTQALYDAATLERFLDVAKLDGVALLAGIIPLKSIKMALWLNENVPGIRVPDAQLAEMQAAADTDGEVAKGIEIAAQVIREVRHLCAGVHVMALGWEAHVPTILEASGVGRRG